MSAPFHTTRWAERFTKLGDQAEAAFEAECNEQGLNFVRYGLARPPISLAKVPARIRYSPDYLMHDRFVEVQGLGRDQVLKLKIDKFGSLLWWNDVWPVELFVYDSFKERSEYVSMDMLQHWLDAGQAALDRFHEGKSYFAFPAALVFGE